MSEIEKNEKIKKKSEKPRKTIGDVIDEDTEWILEASKDIFENKPSHPLWKENEKEIAESFLVDHHIKIFEAEQTIKKVREHYKED